MKIFDLILSLLRDEPVRTALGALYAAGLALLAIFGVELDEEKVGAIFVFGGAVVAVAELVRARVTPTSKTGA